MASELVRAVCDRQFWPGANAGHAAERADRKYTRFRPVVVRSRNENERIGHSVRGVAVSRGGYRAGCDGEPVTETVDAAAAMNPFRCWKPRHDCPVAAGKRAVGHCFVAVVGTRARYPMPTTRDQPGGFAALNARKVPGSQAHHRRHRCDFVSAMATN